MNIIICVDKRGAMMFNNRRVSRDQYVTMDILKTVVGEKLYIKPYSEPLFSPFAEEFEMPTVSDTPLTVVKDGEWCFIEDEDITPYLDKVERLLIYNWNRTYPWQLKFDLESNLCSFRLTDKRKFAGHSHEEITREVYRKQKKVK